MQERPTLELYSCDGVHSSPYGYYLTLCVLYSTVFERTPVGLSYRMQDTPLTLAASEFGWNLPKGWQLPDEDATFLQQVAWDTVQDYQAGK